MVTVTLHSTLTVRVLAYNLLEMQLVAVLVGAAHSVALVCGAVLAELLHLGSYDASV